MDLFAFNRILFYLDSFKLNLVKIIMVAPENESLHAKHKNGTTNTC